MTDPQARPQAYVCPMHATVRESNPGKCPKCGMALMPEGTRFALLRHMASKPWMLLLMIAIMVAVMWTIMALMRR
jgi:hypothetical protein